MTSPYSGSAWRSAPGWAPACLPAWEPHRGGKHTCAIKDQRGQWEGPWSRGSRHRLANDARMSPAQASKAGTGGTFPPPRPQPRAQSLAAKAAPPPRAGRSRFLPYLSERRCGSPPSPSLARSRRSSPRTAAAAAASGEGERLQWGGGFSGAAPPTPRERAGAKTAPRPTGPPDPPHTQHPRRLAPSRGRPPSPPAPRRTHVEAAALGLRRPDPAVEHSQPPRHIPADQPEGETGGSVAGGRGGAAAAAPPARTHRRNGFPGNGAILCPPLSLQHFRGAGPALRRKGRASQRFRGQPGGRTEGLRAGDAARGLGGGSGRGGAAPAPALRRGAPGGGGACRRLLPVRRVGGGAGEGGAALPTQERGRAWRSWLRLLLRAGTWRGFPSREGGARPVRCLPGGAGFSSCCGDVTPPSIFLLSVSPPPPQRRGAADHPERPGLPHHAPLRHHLQSRAGGPCGGAGEGISRPS